MTAVLDVQNLKISYKVKNKQQVDAVRGVSFTVESSRCFGLLGPNGAGKTSTLEMIEGVRTPSAGDILFQGKKRDKHYRNQIGVLFQETALPELLTVKECLTLFNGLYAHQNTSKANIDKVVEMFSLSDLLNSYPKRLSGGQRQRVLLAIALIHDPCILFLDEPTTGLDPKMRQTFWGLIHQVKALGKAVVLTTHYMQEAEALCDDIAIMARGEIVAHGSPQQLLVEHFADTIIRLPKHLEREHLVGFPYELNNVNGMLAFATQSVETAVTALQKFGVSLDGIHISPPTMDDLYIKLTQDSDQNSDQNSEHALA